MNEVQWSRMNNQRRHLRSSVDSMGIQTHVLFARRVKVLDISITGIAFEVPGKLEIHAPYTLKLKNSAENISLKGFVARSAMTGYKVHSRGRKIPVYTVGFEFTDLTPEHIDKVIKFINSSKKANHLKLNFTTAGRLLFHNIH